MAAHVTAPQIRARKGGPKISMVTAYDYPSAMIADRAGIDIILVGDSVANVVHGMSTTLEVGMDEMVLHTRAVRRAEPSALLVVDMPWLSFHISPEDAVRNAGRLVREGGAEAVKLEGGIKRLPMVDAILSAEIPVMGHVGLTPQSVHEMGGFKVQGKLIDAAEEMIEDARALAVAGCFAIVIEGVPDVLGEIITKEVDVPTIGIGTLKAIVAAGARVLAVESDKTIVVDEPEVVAYADHHRITIVALHDEVGTARNVA